MAGHCTCRYVFLGVFFALIILITRLVPGHLYNEMQPTNPKNVYPYITFLKGLSQYYALYLPLPTDKYAGCVCGKFRNFEIPK